MNVQHSSRTDEWGTPGYILTMAKQVLGRIDLDPASSEEFNRTVQARTYLTKADNGLSCPWPVGCTVWLNPPGGKLGNRSMSQLFWDRLIRHPFSHAIYMGFSLEQLQTTQRSSKSIMDFTFCVPRKRICFVDAQGRPGPAPSHSNVIVYLPGSLDRTELFRKVFAELGAVR